MGRLQDKVALVTGGAGGIGRESVRLLAREGARVVATDVDEAAGLTLANELGEQVLFLRHDVASEADWRAVIDRTLQHFAQLDVLVNNAGILLPGTIETATLAQWQQLLRVNADSVFLGTQLGVATMKERGGSIVNIASVSSWLPVDGYAGYSASKAAVAALTRAAALHCRKCGYPLRVNSVHPDGVWTPMMQASAPGIDSKHILYDPKRNPKGRACLPEQVAAVVLFLASDESSAINGAELRVDNGVLGMGL